MPRRLIVCVITLFALLSTAVAFAQDNSPPPLPPLPAEQGVGADEALPPMPPPPPPPPIPKQKPPADEAKEILPNPPAENGNNGLPGSTDVQTEDLVPSFPSSGAKWPMFKGNAAHTGYTEEQLTFPLKLAWRHVTERFLENPSSPAIADGVAYFCSNGRIYAVNVETGSLKWRYPEESLTASIKTSPLIGDDLVYFAAGDGNLYAIDKETGTLKWTFRTKGGIVSSPVLVDGVIYIGATDNNLYALDAATGALKWPGGFRTGDDVLCSPAVAEGLVYFVSNDMVLYAAYTASGKLKWSVRIGNATRNSTPVVAENTVYVGGGVILHAFQAQSGRLRWAVNLPADITTVPAFANGTIYVGCRDGKVYALTSAGKLKWSAPPDLGAPIYGSPIVAGNTVIVGGRKGVLAAIDGTTGEIKWKYILGPTISETGSLIQVNIAAAPAVCDGTLYVVGDDGSLNAFRADAPDTTPPVVEAVKPSRDSVLPGMPPVEFAALVTDPGSGINPKSISMLLDGEAVDYKFAAERGIIWYKTVRQQPITPLKDGRHIVTLSLEDWSGNKTTEQWSFFVDNRLRLAPKPKPSGTETSGTGEGPPPGAAPGEGPPPGYR